MKSKLEKEAMLKTQRVTIELTGLSCGGGGSLAIERALSKLPGVVSVYLNPATEMAYVQFNAELCSPDQLVAVIKRAGFGAGEPKFR